MSTSGVVALRVSSPSLHFGSVMVGEDVSACGPLYARGYWAGTGGYVLVGTVLAVYPDGSADIELAAGVQHAAGAQGYMTAAAYGATPAAQPQQ